MVRNIGDFDASQTTASDMYQLDPFGLIKRKFWTIVFFVILFVALAMLYFFKAPKTYESTARVFIDERTAPTMTADGEMIAESNVEKYLEIINSTTVLSEAIDKCDIEKMDSLSNADNVLFHVRENLKASPSDTKSASGVIAIRYQSGTQEDCQQILTNILDSFQGFIKRDVENTAGDFSTTLSEMETNADIQRALFDTKINTLMQKPFIQVVDGKVYNQHEDQVAKLQEQLHEKESESLQFSALNENLISSRDTGEEIEVVVEAIQEMNEAQLGGYNASQQTYMDLKLQEQEMNLQYGDDHPDLKILRSKVQLADQMRKQQLLSALRFDAGLGNGNDFYTTVSSHITNKIALLKSHETKLAEAIGEAKSKSMEIKKDCDELAYLLEERNKVILRTSEMGDRVSDLEVIRDFDYRDMQVLDPPSTAEQVAPNLLLSLAAGLLLGCLCGFVFSALKEMAEKTFHSSDEISKKLGVNVISHIGVFNQRIPKDSNFKKVSGDVIALHRPQSIQAESFKAFRTSVFFNAQNKKVKVIQITSPSPGDGKSTVSANLAVVMAQSGRRVLLIDCDFRRPSQHKRFGLPNDIGTTTVIVGDATVEESVQVIGLPNLHILTSGPQYANPAELLTTDQLPNLLASVREDYDFIILDTPPVLAVTDPVIVSSFADAIYLPIRIRNGVQVNAQQAIESLATVGANVDGVIVNGLRKKDASSYKYGGYGNSYGYTNGYAARPNPSIGNGKGSPGPARIPTESRN